MREPIDPELLAEYEREKYDKRVAAIVAYEGNFLDMEKLALETLARTARDPLFCYELAMEMNRLRTRIGNTRAQQRAEKRKKEQDV